VRSATEPRIRGAVLCRRRDAFGEIIVAEEGATRSLYFGEGIMQSTIRTDRPQLLLEDYHEAMMSALIFNSQPRSVLLIGLGGCSLVHFLVNTAPDCAIDVVEIRQAVIDLSRDYFLLPADTAKLRIVHSAGEDFITHRESHSRKYDMIIIDAFGENGPAVSLSRNSFLSSCRIHLNESGVFAINLWNSPKHNFLSLYNSIQDAFGSEALKLLLSESYRNAVAFGFKNPSICRNLPDYRYAASELQRKHGINFPKYLKYLYWQNFNVYDQ
jgi:spermidine synthase